MDKNFQPTTLDKAILKVAPGWGLSRIKSRAEASLISGAYEPTRPGNRPFENFQQFLTSPNSRVTSLERQKLINFNRFLVQTGFGGALTNRMTDHAIGNGLTFRASIDHETLGLTKEQAAPINKEFTNLWKLFFQAENGHFDRMYPGGYLQAVAFKSMLEGGDHFAFPAKTKPRKNHRFPFALQLLEAERISTPTGFESDPSYYQGIQKNEAGTPVRIYATKYQGSVTGLRESSYFNPSEWESRQIFGSNTGIRQIFQIKNIAQDRPGALRGIPFLTPSLGLIIDHKEANDAVLKAVKIQSIFAGLWSGGTGGKKLAGAPTNNKTAATNSSFPRVDMTAGQIIDMPEGYDLKGFQTTQPGKDFTPYMKSQLELASAITGIPYSIVMMIYSKNFSANRGELALYWVTVLRYRTAFILQFLAPFWEFLLSWGVANGVVSAPGFFDDPMIKMAYLGDTIHQFSGPRMPQLDLEKEAKGMTAMRDGGFKSTRGLIEQSSEDDPDAVFDELEEERNRGLIEEVGKQTTQLIQENEQGINQNPDDDQEIDEDE
jgi:capsid protein